MQMTDINRKRRNLLVGGLTIVVSILVTLIFVEAATRLLNFISPSMPRSWKEVALSNPPPPPYTNVDFDVVQLTFERNNVNWSAGDDYGYLPKDTKGPYINIVDGLRVTTGSPMNAKNRVWVFGGSTIICMEVPDRYTIPSQIQKILSESNSAPYQVMNIGATSLTTKHQLWRLINSSNGIKKGDIVVFYDGINDIAQSLYYKNPNGTMINANRQQIANSRFTQKTIFYLYEKLADHSAFVRRFLYPFDPEARYVQLPNELVAKMKLAYIKNILEASDYTKERGARFFHFLQPSLYSVNSLTAWEQRLISNGWLYPLELKDVYAIGYPALKEASNELRNKGVMSFDISNSLNERSQEIFLDYAHLNPKGNELIAQTIASHINAH